MTKNKNPLENHSDVCYNTDMQGKLKKRTKVILCTMGAILLVLIIVLSVVCHSRALHAGKISSDGAYASVMSDIENLSDANPRVVDLAMLSSHDANTYNLDEPAGFSGEVKASMVPLYKLAGGLAYRYTKTQVSPIYDQLMQGVRYLHFKISYYDGAWYGSHSLIDGPFEDYVEDVLRFLSNASGEFTVLQFQIMYDSGTTLSAFLARLFGIEYEGHTLADFMPYADIPLGELTYNDVTEHGTRGGAVVMVLRDGALTGTDFYDIEKSVYQGKCYGSLTEEQPKKIQLANKWYNRMDSDALAEAVSRQCGWMKDNFEKYKDGFRIMQMQTSPTLEDAFATVGAWSLVCKAKTHNAKMLENPAFDEWMKIMPIIECDFTTSANGDFNKNVNEKIMTYNRNLAAQMLRVS